MTAGDDVGDVRFTLIFSLVMLLGVYSVSRSRWHFLTSAVLFLPALLGNWRGSGGPREPSEAIVDGFVIAFFVVMSIQVLRYVFEGTTNVGDRVCGALSVYLLIGLAFSELYRACFIVDPESFTTGDPTRPLSIESTRFIYLSFVTQTTMGYGDITPATRLTESLTILQATAGVLYVAVLVAWLVGSIKPISDESGEKSEG